MDDDGWFLGGPVLLLAILVPLARSARWRTLVFPTVLSGGLLAVATLLPWKTVTEFPLNESGWNVRASTGTGFTGSWAGPLLVALGLGVGGAMLWIGARPRSNALVRATGVAAATVAVALASLGVTIADRFAAGAVDPVEVRFPPRAEPECGLFVAALAATACTWLAIATLLGISKERARTRGCGAVDPATLRGVFR